MLEITADKTSNFIGTELELGESINILKKKKKPSTILIQRP